MRILFVSILLFSAIITHAQVVITEVMYDPEGADAGHEWIEIENRGSEPVTIEDAKSGWKLYEDGTNHTLMSVRGGTVLGAGSFAVIADNADNFLANNPLFDGILFDSSFSLKNTGELVALKNSSGEEESSLAYDPMLGGNGDGNSLQENNNVWIAAVPTPGIGVSSSSPNSSPQESSSSRSGGGDASTSTTHDTPTLSLRTQGTVAIVGAPYVFEPRVGGGVQEAYFRWSFGDGSTSATWGSQSVSHTYYYPGTYTVFLEAPELDLSTKLSVRVVSPSIAVMAHGDTTRSFITIENRGNEEISLENWQLLANGGTFTLPKIVIASKQSVQLPSEVTRLITPEGVYAELRFPSGARVTTIVAEETSPRESVAISPMKSSANISPVEKISSPQSRTEKPLLPSDTSYEEGTSTFDLTSQEASLVAGDKDHAWQWYTGAALIALFALLGLRFVRARQTPADEYEIIEDES